jgi:hypothetical protein
MHARTCARFQRTSALPQNLYEKCAENVSITGPLRDLGIFFRTGARPGGQTRCVAHQCSNNITRVGIGKYITAQTRDHGPRKLFENMSPRKNDRTREELTI